MAEYQSGVNGPGGVALEENEENVIRQQKNGAGASSNNHLNFSSLINQQDEPAQPASGIRAMPGSDANVDISYAGWNSRSFPSAADLTSPHDYGELFGKEKSEPKPSDDHLKLNFSEPSVNLSASPPPTSSSSLSLTTSPGGSADGNERVDSNVSTFAAERFGEKDYSSHRRNVIHMSHPMSSHLSTNELKTIKSAQALSPESKKSSSSSSSRRHRGSSSSSEDRQKYKEEKKKRKERERKEKKKNKRTKLIPSKMRNVDGIPEEDEDDIDVFDDVAGER